MNSEQESIDKMAEYEQEIIQCKSKLLDNLTGLKAVVDNFENMVNNSDYIDNYRVESQINVMYYFIESIKKGVELVNDAKTKKTDEFNKHIRKVIE